MARIRTIKPEFWTDEKLVECTPVARLLFIGLLNFADDNGNLTDSSVRIKMQIFPADTIDVLPLLKELITHGLLSEYSVNCNKYLHIKGFKSHQVINRPSKSAIPEPPLTEDSLTEGKGKDKKERKEESKKVSTTTSSPLPPSPEPADAPTTTIDQNRIEKIPKTHPLNGSPYHGVEFHPRFNEVREYITARLPALNRQNATEINRWLQEGADPDTEIYPAVDNAIEFKRGDIGSFSYFSKSINTLIELKKEREEQDKRLRGKYAKPE